MMKFVKWVGIGLIALVAILFVALQFVPPNEARVTLVNKTDIVIQSGKIGLCGESGVFDGLGPGQSASFVLKIRHDCHYEIEVVFASGKRVTGGGGYVTHGMGSNDVVNIYENRVELAPKGL